MGHSIGRSRGGRAVAGLRAVGLLCAFALLLACPSQAGAADPPPGSEDEAAAAYYQLLLQQTRWVESTWSPGAQAYRPPSGTDDEQHASLLLGNAVLLCFGDYDEEIAGVDRETLREHTLSSLDYYLGRNRWINPGGTWGGPRIYWDSTYQSYFAAAAKLLWDELDPEQQDAIDQILINTADHLADLEDAPDPFSGWTFSGLEGNYEGDSKIEEMGARVIPLAAGLAHHPNADKADKWREWMNIWALNMGGLPPADEANPTVIDGRTVAEWNSAHNIWDTFVVENHGDFNPHYQAAISAQPGHGVLHFLIAGQPVPQGLRTIPNAGELWNTLRHLGTATGLAEDLLEEDRHHLYGINAMPIVYRAMVLGDRSAARAELMLLDRFGPYASYPPENRLTKFTAGLHYEAESRAEIATAYLFHYWRDRLNGDVEPLSEAEFFAGAARAADYGADVGLIAHQTERSLSAAVSRAGYVKFAFLPQHDDWLFDAAGHSASLIPSTSTQVLERKAHEYREKRDGVEATATMLRTPNGYAGYTTLPNGQAVYATSGLADGEGVLRVHNIDMPGVPGLDGDRTYTTEEGSVTAALGGLGDGDIDDVRFEPVTARHVRFKPLEAGSPYGYSLWSFEVHLGDGPDLALGKTATASSAYNDNWDLWGPDKAVDGDPTTQWAINQAERPCPSCPWLAVDLGEPMEFDRVVLHFDPAYATKYSIQISDDGEAWTDVITVPLNATSDGGWLNVDGRAGFVVRGSENPIRVAPDRVVLSDGPASGAAGMVVWARPGELPAETAAAADLPQPAGGPPALRAALTDGFLSLFNLGAGKITGAELEVPQGDHESLLYRGMQRTGAGATIYEVTLAGGDARVEAPRFHLASEGGGPPPSDLLVRVRDSRTVEIRNASNADAALEISTADGAESAEVEVPAGEERTVTFAEVPLTPVFDLVRSRITYPTSPLPEGMTDPDLAVDGDPETTWRPGPAGRMVVDLGAQRTLSTVALTWGPGTVRPVSVEVSDDGLEYETVAVSDPDELEGRTQLIDVSGEGRYLAVRVSGWSPGDAELAEISAEIDPPTVSAKLIGATWQGAYVNRARLVLTTSSPIGVESIEYRVGDGDWQVYEGELVFDEPGDYHVEYRAIDSGERVGPVGDIEFTVLAKEGCVPPLSDEFEGDALDTGRWSFLHPTTPSAGPGAPSVSGGALNLPLGAYSVDLDRPGPIAFLGQPLPEGDFTVTAKISAPGLSGDSGGQGSLYAQVGLKILQDDDNWIKVTHTRNAGGGATYFELGYEDEGVRTLSARFGESSGNPSTWWTQITREGDEITARYSLTDPDAPGGTNWVELGMGPGDPMPNLAAIFDPADGPVYIGPYGGNGSITATFDYIRFEPDELDCPDAEAPATTAQLDPALPGPGGTYNQPVKVTLTATDGEGGSGVAYTEYRIDGGEWVASENTEGADPFVTEFTVTDAGEHTVEYRSADAAGNAEEGKSVSFEIAQPPVGPVPVNLEPPTVDGSGKAGTMLTCSPGTWTLGGSYTYTWWRDSGEGLEPADNRSTNPKRYRTAPEDVGSQVICRVTRTNAHGTSAPADSAPVAIVPRGGAGDVPENTVEPTLTDSSGLVVGQISAGRKLKCDRGEWTGTGSYSIAWLRDGQEFQNPSTNPTSYNTTVADIGSEITCVVTRTSKGGTSEPAYSNDVLVTP